MSAQRIEEKLVLQVSDDGVGLPAMWSCQSHKDVGLSVTRERFAGLYPDNTSQLDVRRRDEGGTEVYLSFPLRKRKETHDGDKARR